jgi:hypothetical protein
VNEPRRFQMHYGLAKQHGPDVKGYVIIDTANNNKVVFTSHSRGDTEQEADRLNEEGGPK